MSYRTYEQETLGILEVLLQWEDKLLGRKIVIITDHHTLEFCNTQRTMSLRQIRWYEYLSRFNYTIQYVEGVKNVVADALSRMYAGRHDAIPIDDWVNADIRLDPEGETLPIDRLLESRAMQLRPRGPAGMVLKEQTERRIIESEELRKVAGTSPSAFPRSEHQDTLMGQDRTVPPVAKALGPDEVHPVPPPERAGHEDQLAHEEDLAWSSGSLPVPLEVHLEGRDFLTVIRSAYQDDSLFSKIISHPEQHPKYAVRDGILYTKNAIGNEVIAVPGALFEGRRVTEIAIDQAHRTVGHKAAQKTRDYLSRWFWWPTLAKDVE